MRNPRRKSSDPIQDQLKLWDLVVFNFLLGNTDAHLKNYSLLHGQNPKSVRLAPAYDLVSTTAYKSSTRDMSFRIGGRISIDKINRAAFAEAAREVGLGQRIALPALMPWRTSLNPLCVSLRMSLLRLAISAPFLS